MNKEITSTEVFLSEEETRLKKREDLINNNQVPYKYNYKKTHKIKDIILQNNNLEIGEEIEELMSIAGRLMAKRGHGKATFGNVRDDSGTLQYYANINTIDEDRYKLLLSLDVGDILGIKGQLFRSKKGELTLRIKTFELLTKSLKPLPEKFHGFQDKESRYRQRYVDLIANEDVKTVFKKRSEIILKMRQHLTNKEFIEVETPVLHRIYGGAAAKPFKTYHNECEQNLYLRIALELHHKRLLVGGFEKIFEIGRVFRNEGVSYKHNPEYTLLELYQAYADYTDMMTLTEDLITMLAHEFSNGEVIDYQTKQIEFKKPFERITFYDAIKKYAGISDDEDLDSLRKKAKQEGMDVNQKTRRGQLLNYIYDKCVEHHLIQPTFVIDPPWETSPLAKRKRDNDACVERFELIINGMEIANAFSELNDPVEQQLRFEDQLKAKEAGDEEFHQMDEDFINALRYGMPPTGGVGMGIDRVVMLLTNSASIRDVLLFPHMKDKT